MDSIEKQLEQEKKKVSELEHRLSLYENDSVFKGYYALNKIVNQQIKRLNAFDLDTEISQNPKDDKVYDRTKAIWEGLKGMISDLNALKSELKISGNEDKDSKKVPFIETVATTRN